MRLLAQNLNSMYTQWNLPMKDKETFCTLLLSRSIAFNLQLPSSPVENPASFYESNYSNTVKDIICSFNDYQIIPYEAVINATRAVWMHRYEMVYNPTGACMEMMLALSEKSGSLTDKKTSEFFDTYKDFRFSVSNVWRDGTNMVAEHLYKKANPELVSTVATY